MSTRSDSYEAIKPRMPSIKGRVLETVRNFPSVSREDVAEYLGIRISTACSATNALLKAGKVKVVGRQLSRDTNRMVEVLATA